MLAGPSMLRLIAMYCAGQAAVAPVRKFRRAAMPAQPLAHGVLTVRHEVRGACAVLCSLVENARTGFASTTFAKCMQSLGFGADSRLMTHLARFLLQFYGHLPPLEPGHSRGTGSLRVVRSGSVMMPTSLARLCFQRCTTQHDSTSFSARHRGLLARPAVLAIHLIVTRDAFTLL